MIFNDFFDTLWNEKDNILLDKRLRVRDLVSYMLDRTQQIFIWKGLPETIPAHELEFMLQVFGNVCITDVAETPNERIKTGLYALYGGLGGVPDAYYNPTIYTIANPYLNFSKQLEIGFDCVRARNDKLGIGFLPMFIKYATMQNENEISMNMLSIVYRIGEIISADDDRTYESAKEYYNNVVAGKFGAIASSEFFDGVQVDKSQSNKSIKDLIEYEQYIKASWFNEIGLNSNYNMKRERIVSTEAEMNDDALIPFVENMLTWRRKAIEDVKELYGDKFDLGDLTVDLNYIWDLDNMYRSIPKDSATGETEEPDSEESDLEEPDSEESDLEESDPEESDSEDPEQIDVNININVEGSEEDEKETD